MTQPVSGTSSARGGLRRTTGRWNASFSARLAGFALAVVVAAVLIIRIDTSIWRQQGRLQEEFADVKAEKFYFGVNFRVSLRQIRETWLDRYLTGNPVDQNAFRREALALQGWLRNKEKNFATPGERERFRRLEAAFGDFVNRMDRLMQESGPRPGREGFAEAYEQLHTESRSLLKLCDEMVEAEHNQFDIFLKTSDQTLLSLQRLLLLSLVLLVGSAAALAVAVYRGMIAPLRAQLSQSQAIIERQEKLAALGTLGAGVAHEIRNPLTAIKFRLFSLMEALPANFAENEDARTISEEINRLDHIVTDFLQFARPSEPELTRVPAERILQEVADFMKPQLQPSAIELRPEILQPAWIGADTHQLKQVLINLIQNAADSIGKNGRITLRLRLGQASFAGRTRPAAILSVEDSGKGIPPQVQKRLFDPFFTTKEDGTGLGLAIAARIVEKHGGLLNYKTELNRGTIFQIVLPALEDHAG
jgi:signal transduction histidine kinase